MTRKPIVVILAALGLSASAALAEPTGLSSANRGHADPEERARSDLPPGRRAPRDGRRQDGDCGDRNRSGEARVMLTRVRRKAQPARAHRNSPHPAVLSHSHPVYPIGVPLPPVSLERY